MTLTKSKNNARKFTKNEQNNESGLKKTDTRIFALGGLNEVGKNCYVVEQDDEIIVIDAGVKFASEGLPGIDYVIPDFSYLKYNSKKIKGLFITHGHEDHIGGIPFLLQIVPIPIIYASPLACAMIRRKLEEHRLTNATKLVQINRDSLIKTKHFSVGFFNVNHSIPEAMGVIINTENGRIVETGDFKFDLTPVAQAADYQRISFMGETGVDLLLADSTNAEVPNFSISEKKVAQTVQKEFRKAEGRIIVATFASNIHRVQQIIDAAVRFNRKILVYGRSMENNITISRKLGYIKCPDRFFISNEEAKHLSDDEILILCTGSQGEALAALSRIANGTHRQIKIKPGDTVVFSSNPIPGNQSSVNRVINKLYRAGAKVLENSSISNLHTSGHASQEEMKLMFLLTRPHYFFPIHGEYKMLVVHSRLYEEVGGDINHAFICSNGDSLILRNHEVFPGPRVHADDIYVDGNDLSGLSTSVLHDRTVLSEDGMVSVLVSMDSRAGTLLNRPIIMSRGFVYMKDSTEMIHEAENLVGKKLTQQLKGKTTFAEIKNTIRDTLMTYFYQKTRRHPMVIPVIMNKKS